VGERVAGIGALLWRPSADGARSGLAAVFLIGAAMTFALAGHEASAARAPAVTVAHGVHLAAGALWFGGLAALAASLPLFKESRRSVTLSFSGVALWSVALVAATGFGLTYSHNGGLGGLLARDWGRTLALKIALVATAVAAGAFSRRRAHGVERPGLSLVRSVAFEVVVITLVLLVTGALVSLSPARSVRAVVPAFSADEPIPGGRLVATVDPTRDGGAAIHVLALGASGSEADIVDGVRVRFLLAAQDIGPIERELERVSSGHFTYTGNDMSMPGRWRIQLRAKVSDFEEEAFVYDIEVGTGD
jgi:copper transport protein